MNAPTNAVPATKVTLFSRVYGNDFNSVTLSPTEGNEDLPTFTADISAQTAALPKALRGILALGIANLISARFASAFKDSAVSEAAAETTALIAAILDGSYTSASNAPTGSGYGIAGVTAKLAAAAVAVKYGLTSYGQAVHYVNPNGPTGAYKPFDSLMGILLATKDGASAKRSALAAKVPETTALIAKWDAEYAATKRSRPSTAKEVVAVEEVQFEF